jgi:GAF domain-containing protein
VVPSLASGSGRVGGGRLHRSGRDAQRVLLVADRAIVDDGGALPERLADAVAARTRRGLDLDVAWDVAPALEAVEASTEAWRLWRYEAVVLLVRGTDLQAASRWWGGRIRRVAQRVLPELAEASAVLVVRLDDRDRGGTTMEAHLATEPAVRSATARLDADGRLGDPAQADAIADEIAGLLTASARRAARGRGRTAVERRAEPQPEADRQRAVDAVTEGLGGVNPHLERVVLLARNTFDVPFAQVNLLDHGRIRTLAFVGAPGDDAVQPICTITVRGSGPTIIADTWQDPRLDDNPHVHGAEHPVRFYAAHPIESTDGYRVGTLCVFDMKPHDVRDVDPAVLRDLALLAEAEISTLPGA